MNKPMRIKHLLFNIANNTLVDLPAPINISSWWNFGSLLGLCLIIQIMTGLFLAMHSAADINLAFNKINYTCRDVILGDFYVLFMLIFFYLYLFTCSTSNML